MRDGPSYLANCSAERRSEIVRFYQASQYRSFLFQRRPREKKRLEGSARNTAVFRATNLVAEKLVARLREQLRGGVMGTASALAVHSSAISIQGQVNLRRPQVNLARLAASRDPTDVPHLLLRGGRSASKARQNGADSIF